MNQSGPSERAHERVSRAIRETRLRLRDAGITAADAEARAIVAHAAGSPRSLIVIDSLPLEFEEQLESVIRRRVRREPLQLILGRTVFRRVVLDTAQGVFIPRPETEVAIDVVHDWASSFTPSVGQIRALDCCTGSGTLACALIDEFPLLNVQTFDMNPNAVALATSNLERAAEGNSDRFSVRECELPSNAEALAQFASEVLATGPGSVGHPFDLIVANPPYIPSGTVPRDVEVLDYDPPEALFGGGEDGLDVPRAVVQLAAMLIADAGLFVMEHADVQGAQTRELASATDRFEDVRTVKDLTGRDRFLVARAKRT